MVSPRRLFAAVASLGLAATALPHTDHRQTVLGDPTLMPTHCAGEPEEAQGFEVVHHQSLAEYRLRVTKPTLCEDPVKQYSGYLDISNTKHLFYWFFEARHSPRTAPLILWLNGGPGSSTIASGLLFEHGPCLFSAETNTTYRNEFGWNERANIIYLDQPVGTGYSYATNPNDSIATLEPLAADVYALLQVFLTRFPEYANAPFHVMGESWGGHYVPRVVDHIFRMNERMVYAPFPGQLRVNLESLVVANGLTEPLSQLETTTDFLCGGGPYSPFKHDDWRCKAARLATRPCLDMIRACYRHDNNVTCATATNYCWPAVEVALVTASGRNPYDLRYSCGTTETGLCYPELDPLARVLNSTATKKALGANVDIDYVITNTTINAAFYRNGQATRNTAALLPNLINNGIRVMAYAGDTDAVCNYVGIELWMTRLKHAYHEEFSETPTHPWRTIKSGSHVGNVRSAGPGAGNVTFVRVFEGGHVVPHDQPEATQDMILRWIENKPFY